MHVIGEFHQRPADVASQAQVYIGTGEHPRPAARVREVGLAAVAALVAHVGCCGGVWCRRRRGVVAQAQKPGSN